MDKRSREQQGRVARAPSLASPLVRSSLGVLLLGMLAACGQDQRGQVPPATATTAAPSALAAQRTRTAVIPIEGMSCASCTARVKKALTAVDGVVTVEVRLAERDAKVQYIEEKITAERLASVVAELGYEVGAPKRGE